MLLPWRSASYRRVTPEHSRQSMPSLHLTRLFDQFFIGQCTRPPRRRIDNLPFLTHFSRVKSLLCQGRPCPLHPFKPFLFCLQFCDFLFCRCFHLPFTSHPFSRSTHPQLLT